jgi:hypothetical protein
MSFFLIHPVLAFVRPFPLFLCLSSVERLSILGLGSSTYTGYDVFNQLRLLPPIMPTNKRRLTWKILSTYLRV